MTSLFADCDSQWINEQNITDIIKDKKYVALVRITEILEIENQFEKTIRFETLRQYKGQTKSSFKYTDRISFTPGEEWILINDTLKYQSQCFSKLYKNYDGFIRQGFSSGFQILNYLDKYLDHPKYTDVESKHYPNGRLRWKIRHHQKVKKGTSIYYYPNGSLYMKENYKAGLRNGKTVQYDIHSRKVLTYEFNQDSLVQIVNIRVEEDVNTVRVNRYGKFIEKIYPKGIHDISYHLKSPADSILKTYIRTITNSNYNRDIIEYSYDSYLSNKLQAPQEEGFTFHLKNKEGRTKQSLSKNFHLISNETFESKNTTQLVFVFKEENLSWFPQSKRLIFYSPDIGIFFELWSDNSTLSIAKHPEKTALINFAKQIITNNELNF